MRQIRHQNIEKANKTPSKGNQGKYHIGDEWIKIDYLGYEAASEYLVSELLRHSNISNFVSYSIEKVQIENANGFFRNHMACISQNFVPEGAETITLDKFLRQKLHTTFEQEIKGKSTKEAIAHIVNLVETNTNIENFGQYLTAMFEMDAFVLNEDRHIQNIVLLHDSEGYHPSPIFDNGSAFLSDIQQEYPLEERTKDLISCVRSKPFNTSFLKQVEACHELYGKQLFLETPNLSRQIGEIRSCYGDRIADRMEYIYDIQIQKYKNLLNIKDTSKTPPKQIEEECESLYSEKEMFAIIREHIQNGGKAVMKTVENKFLQPLKEALLEEEIPFLIVNEKNNTFTFVARDIDSRDFLRAQKEVFSALQPPKLTPEKHQISSSKESYILTADEYDDI